MAWPKTYRPEDHLGRNMSPEKGVQSSMQAMHGNMRDDKTFTMTPYSIMNPFSRENEQALRESQKAWERKMKLIEDAEKTKKRLVDYGRRLQVEGEKGLQPGGTKESQMRKMWGLQDAAEKAQSDLDAYWGRRESMKELKGKRRGKFYPGERKEGSTGLYDVLASGQGRTVSKGLEPQRRRPASWGPTYAGNLEYDKGDLRRPR